MAGWAVHVAADLALWENAEDMLMRQEMAMPVLGNPVGTPYQQRPAPEVFAPGMPG